jgi:hypothetical protein
VAFFICLFTILAIYVSIWNISKGGENMAKEYKVVRSYDDGTDKYMSLQNLFDEGWQFERASEYVPWKEDNKTLRYGYIEYILFKEVENEK